MITFSSAINFLISLKFRGFFANFAVGQYLDNMYFLVVE